MSNSLQPVIGVRTCYCHLVQMVERYYSSQLCRYFVDRRARLEITGWICNKREAPRCALRINHVFITVRSPEIVRLSSVCISSDGETVHAVA